MNLHDVYKEAHLRYNNLERWRSSRLPHQQNKKVRVGHILETMARNAGFPSFNHYKAALRRQEGKGPWNQVRKNSSSTKAR